MNATIGMPRLHVLTDARSGRGALDIIAGALSGGAPLVQVRAKGVTDRELYDLAVRVSGLCAAAGASCIVDDRVDIALAVGAAGTHLPEPIGSAGVAAVTAAVDIPVIAIGGITAARVPELLAAGAHGVAVVAAVSGAADPAEAVRALLRALGPGSVSGPA